MTTDAMADIIKLCSDRRELGLKQYGVAVSAANSEQWFQHWLKEAADSMAYALAAKDRLRMLEQRTKELEAESEANHLRAVKAEDKAATFQMHYTTLMAEKNCTCDPSVAGQCGWCLETTGSELLQPSRDLRATNRQLQQQIESLEANAEGEYWRATNAENETIKHKLWYSAIVEAADAKLCHCADSGVTDANRCDWCKSTWTDERFAAGRRLLRELATLKSDKTRLEQLVTTLTEETTKLREDVIRQQRAIKDLIVVIKSARIELTDAEIERALDVNS